MSFPEGVAARALVASGRCCCICHKFCGTKIELHHIKQHAYGGEDTFENCIPLCFDCHEDMGKADPREMKNRLLSEKISGKRMKILYCELSIDSTFTFFARKVALIYATCQWFAFTCRKTK